MKASSFLCALEIADKSAADSPVSSRQKASPGLYAEFRTELFHRSSVREDPLFDKHDGVLG